MYKLRVVILQKNDPFHECIMVEFKCLFFLNFQFKSSVSLRNV